MASDYEVRTFINQIAPLVQKYAKECGYKVASPIIAQACVESAYGTSSLSRYYHNYFGLKCGTKWKGPFVNLKTKEEYSPGQLTEVKDFFRVYKTVEDGVKGYFDFISTTRYSNLKTAKTPQEYLELIKEDGYCTSNTYVQTNMNVVKKFNLEQYDAALKAKKKSVIEIAKEVIAGKWGNGQARQVNLAYSGYDYTEIQKSVNDLLKNK